MNYTIDSGTYASEKVFKGQPHKKTSAKSTHDTRSQIIGSTNKSRKYTILITYLLTYGAEPFLRSRQLCRERPSILWNPKVQYRLHKSPTLVPILSHINPIHTSPFYLRSILILSTHLCLGLRSVLFPSGFPTNTLHACHFLPIYVTWPANLILFNLIFLIIFGEEYKL
jgi:hypothetical protein